MKYRAEIDGLRALAVIPVILFHAGFELFSGGFVGVDVFFVISGYLITSILIGDLEKGRFSIVNFYERRARRILPALFFVMLACIPFAWLWMLPSQIKEFSHSFIAVSFFASNILFWRESGYFAAEAEEKPLLHTWSLAVEEQYYLLFPVFLLFAWRFGRNPVFWMIVAMSAISLVFSELGWRHRPTANFYLAPTRAWELFAGSIAAFIVHKRGVQSNNTLSLIGLFAIVFSMFFYSDITPFPSVYALVPVLGVVLLILFAEKDTLAAKILAMRIPVAIGLISYSAYLWHQPLFAFAKIKAAEEPSSVLMSLLFVVSLILAFFSWKYIETPFRAQSQSGLSLSRSRIFTLSLAGLIGFISLGLFGHKGNGDLGRWDESIIAFENTREESNEYVWSEKNRLRLNNFEPKPSKILVVGDSNSGDLINVLNTLADANTVSFSSLTINAGCGNLYLPKDDYAHFIAPDREAKCKEVDSLFSSRGEQLLADADHVILASSWDTWEAKMMAKSAARLIEQYGEKFWWFGNKHIDFPEVHELYKEGVLDLALVYPMRENKQAINQELARALGDRFINPYQLFCNGEQCDSHDSNGDVLLYDGFHLTRSGAKFFGSRLDDEYPNFVQTLALHSVK